MKVSTIIRATVLLLSLILISNSDAQSSTQASAKRKGWSNWVNSKCSVTCGNGRIRRRRVCLSGKCKGKSTALKKCRAGSCHKWSPWSTFRPCDTTCGQGIQTRTRKCVGGSKCKGKPTHTQPCNLKPCPVSLDESGFTFWTKFGPCSDTCGGGIQSRNRTCPNGDCAGHLQEIRNCRMKACAGKETVSWGKYGPCSVTCGTGMRSRFKGSVEQKVTCILPECTFPVDGYSAWSNYGKCSVNCGGGIQKRTRTCLNGECSKHDTETRNCKNNICRADKCRNKLGKRCNRLKSRCKTASIATSCKLTCKKCPVVVSWGEYGPCSAKCGAGLQTRTKGMVKQSITCFGNACDTAVYNWGQWTDSECTVTCGGGTITRSRICQGSNECDGPPTETVTCKTQICPPEWADWSGWISCTKTCGSGVQERARTCKLQRGCETLVGERTQQALCNVNPCPTWQDWSSWSVCTKTCGGGTITRDRTCSAPGQCKGEGSQTTNCNTYSCAEWGDWSLWSVCTKSCGVGKHSRKRGCTIEWQCNTLEGKSEETEDCNTGDCLDDNLGDSSWSQCSESCGDGMRNRQKCTGGTCVQETEACNNGECVSDNSDDGWSHCSKSCDEGTRSRTNCTSGTCVQEYDGCNMGKCAEVKCRTENLFRSNRYGSGHECCDDTRSTPDSTCGRISSKSERRVIGGVDAKKGQWPWMAAVQMTSGFCAGSIISENFVLSAAHCFAYDSGRPMNTTYWRIIPGILLLADVASATRYKISSTYIHPDYSFPKADIALVKLTENLKFGDVQPICLPRGERPSFDSTCYVTGWGVSTIPNTVTNHLQELGILNLDPRACIEAYNKHENLQHHVPFLKSNQGYTCAGSLSRAVDSCSGDSGGPLVCQRCNSCTWYIAGIVSFGPNPCAIIGVPGIYSSVQYYEDWIIKTTGLPKYSLSCSKN